MANFSKKTLLTVIGLLILIADPIRLHSDDSGPDPNRTTVAPTQNSKQQIKDQELNSQSEQLALQFVTDHLPQLKPILEQLKLDQTRQYERAFVDLARSSKKLNVARKRVERLFQVELELPRAEMEANLIAARLKLRDKLQDRDQLRDAVACLHSAKEVEMQYELEVLRTRLARDQALLATAEQNLSALKQDSSNNVDAVYLSLLLKADRKSGAAKTKNTSDSNMRIQKTTTTSSEQ